jgi:hypothetical protein
MNTNGERTSPFTDINGLVADFLNNVTHRPVPHGVKTRLTEIGKAVAEGSATVDMALDIINVVPMDNPGRASDQHRRSNGARSVNRKNSYPSLP